VALVKLNEPVIIVFLHMYTSPFAIITYKKIKYHYDGMAK